MADRTVLPMRFGTRLADEDDLHALLDDARRRVRARCSTRCAAGSS